MNRTSYALVIFFFLIIIIAGFIIGVIFIHGKLQDLAVPHKNKIKIEDILPISSIKKELNLEPVKIINIKDFAGIPLVAVQQAKEYHFSYVSTEDEAVVVITIIDWQKVSQGDLLWRRLFPGRGFKISAYCYGNNYTDIKYLWWKKDNWLNYAWYKDGWLTYIGVAEKIKEPQQLQYKLKKLLTEAYKR